VKALDDDFKKLIAYCRKNGVQTLKIDGVEVSLHPSAFFPESAYRQKKKQSESQSENIPIEGAEYLNDPDAAIDWSSGGIPRSN